MPGVYYKKVNIALSDYKLVTTVQTPQITAYVENDIAFFLRKVAAVFGAAIPKLQKTNCIEMLL